MNYAITTVTLECGPSIELAKLLEYDCVRSRWITHPTRFSLLVLAVE